MTVIETPVYTIQERETTASIQVSNKLAYITFGLLLSVIIGYYLLTSKNN